MIPEPTDWQGVALAKLTRVLGEEAGRSIMAQTLADLGLAGLRSADDLRAFARQLEIRGGFAGAVAGLLGMHVAMYDGTPATGSSRPPGF